MAILLAVTISRIWCVIKAGIRIQLRVTLTSQPSELISVGSLNIRFPPSFLSTKVTRAVLSETAADHNGEFKTAAKFDHFTPYRSVKSTRP